MKTSDIAKVKRINAKVADDKFTRAGERYSQNSSTIPPYDPTTTMNMDIDEEEDSLEDRMDKEAYRAEKKAWQAKVDAEDKAYFDTVKKRYRPVANQVDEFRYSLSNQFSSLEDFKNLLTAAYEVIGKRYFEAKRNRDPKAREWINIINEAPDIALPVELTEGAVASNIDDLIKMVEVEVKTPKDAVALLFAIALEIEAATKLEGGETDMDSVIEDIYGAFDTKFRAMSA